MSVKKWLIMFALAVVLALVLCAAFNILVDPFGVFGDPILDWYSYNETNNPRVAKLAWLEEHHKEYDSYIIGSSSAASYSVEELNGYLDARFYNLFVYGCDTRDYCDFAAYVLENYEVKNLILNIGINEGNSYDEGQDSLNEKMHALTTRESLFGFYLQYAFCNPQFSLDKLRSYKEDTDLPQVVDVFEEQSGCYDKRVRDVEKIGDPAVYQAAHGGDFAVAEDTMGLPYTQACAESVAYIRRLCQEKGVSLTVLASPVYIGQWEAYDPQVLRAYKEAIAAQGDYWDFSLTEISYDSRYFYDATHFRNAVGSMILAEIFGNDQVWRPENFGTYVTGENREAALDALFTPAAAPDPGDYTVDVPILMYHHFADEVTADTVLTPAQFEAQLQAIRAAGYTTVTFDQLVDYVYHGGSLPQKPVCITMDDGYLSNYEIALPLLEQYDMKATVFAIGVSVGAEKYYKDTEYTLIPHFSYAQAAQMLASGRMDIQSHTYDMHQWAPYETGPVIRSDILPLAGESEADYAAALQADLDTFSGLYRQELGRDVIALAYPGGKYCTLSEVLIHQAGIPVTLSTDTDRRNVLVRGLPQSLYAMCRLNVDETITTEELLAFLEGSGQ